MALTKSEVLASLERVASPDGLALPKTSALSDVVVSDGKVFFSITVDAAVVNAWEPIRRRAEAAVKALPGVTSVMVALTAERAAGRPQPGATSPAAAAAAQRAHGTVGVPGVEAIIAVASGKGGVAKSTIAVNLALGLRDLGLRVGVLDADIYGPSIPKLFAIKGRPQTRAAPGSSPWLRNENAALKKGASCIRMKVSEKGAVSIYGMGRFPVTLYKEQWLKLLDMSDDIRAFIAANEAQLKAGAAFHCATRPGSARLEIVGFGTIYS